MDFSGWILLIESVVFIISIVVGIFIIKRMGEGISTSDTFVILRDGSKTNQRVLGDLVDKSTGKNGRIHLKVLLKDTKKPEVVEVIAEPNKIIPYPKGGWSGGKSIIEVLPNSAQDYISNMISIIEEKSAESHIIKAQREGINRQSAHLLEIGEGEVSELNLGLSKDFINKLVKTQAKEEFRKSSGTYPTSGETFRA